MDSHNRVIPGEVFKAKYWPTLGELRAVTRSETDSTIRQILSGQGYFYGYECERFCDNEVQMYENVIEALEPDDNSEFYKAVKVTAKVRKISLKDAEAFLRKLMK